MAKVKDNHQSWQVESQLTVDSSITNPFVSGSQFMVRQTIAAESVYQVVPVTDIGYDSLFLNGLADNGSECEAQIYKLKFKVFGGPPNVHPIKVLKPGFHRIGGCSSWVAIRTRRSL